MFEVDIAVEHGDEYGEHDLLLAHCKLDVMPQVGHFIDLDLKCNYLVQKINHSILLKDEKQFIRIYVYKL